MKLLPLATFVILWMAFLNISQPHADQSEIMFFGSPHASVQEEPDEQTAPVTFSMEVPGLSIEVTAEVPEGHEAGFDHTVLMRKDKCSIKASFFEDMVASRAPVEQGKEELERILQVLENYWGAPDRSIAHYEHVDNQRRTRDAYRVQSGEYIVKDPRAYGLRVFADCLTSGF